jgi:hypothetical protein
MNIPIYVLDTKLWNNYFPATSVPYFDNRCGFIEINLNNLDLFYDKLQEFNPRQYILENHTLMTSAQKYIDILKTK